MSDETIMPEVVFDPLSPDAPLEHLLSIRHNPLVKDMSPDELRTLIQKLRTLASSPPSLSSAIQSSSDNANPKKRTNTIAAKRKAILADL